MHPPGNRLAGSTSPYLLQHKDNPVDWNPWSGEALEAARRLDRPIFLSIGYSACHWCHVMEKESFEDSETAALMNRHFVNIKVDREERPDLDDLYMTAVQLMTGSGGWPMSVWLTPDLKPFYAGTYFPREPHHGRPSFRQVLTALGEAWAKDRAALTSQAEKVHEALRQHLSGDRTPPGRTELSADLMARALDELSDRFDHVEGGFGAAPKFPPSRSIALLLERYRRSEDPNLLRMATLTLDKMAHGGMYDQIGGGFHRYSTDRFWLVPHFEKMLYDNALLAQVYLDAWRTTRTERYALVARGTLDFVLRDMTDPSGAFYSSLDADSEGEEGRYYVWRPSEVIEVLGPVEGALVNAYYGITEAGNFEGGASIPHVEEPPEAFADRRKLSPGELAKRLESARSRLLARRSRRVPPHLDDKVLTAWNGLMIAALADAGRTLGERRYTEAAARAAAFLLARPRGPDGLLRVSHRGGRSREESFLDDQAFFLEGLLVLHEATREERWLDAARSVAKAADTAFWDPDQGGYFFAPSGRSDLLIRAKNPLDGATPSGNSVMADCLQRLSRLTGEPAHGRRSAEILATFSAGMKAMPGAFHNMLIVLDRRLASGGDAPGGPTMRVTADGPSGPVPPGSRAGARVTLTLAPGWHVNANRPTKPDLVPTTVVLESGGPFSLVTARYPEPRMVALGFAGGPIAVYEGEATVVLDLQVDRAATPGRAVARGTLEYQACNDRACLPPARASFAIPLTVGSASTP